MLNWVGLYHKRNQIARTLSGGEQQRVAIARAIVNRPKILLADEPTGNLDPEVSQEVLDLLFRINAAGTAVLMSTHDHLMVRQYGERVISLSQGRVVADLERYRPAGIRDDARPVPSGGSARGRVGHARARSPVVARRDGGPQCVALRCATSLLEGIGGLAPPSPLRFASPS